MNLRQDVTRKAREVADIPHGSQCPFADGESRADRKAIKAVVLDGVTRLAVEFGTPRIGLRRDYDLMGSFTTPAIDRLSYYCSMALDEYSTAQLGLVRDYATTTAPLNKPLTSDKAKIEVVIGNIHRFIMSGVGFSAVLINLAQISKREEDPSTIYDLLNDSYRSMVKKFTGGKSLHTLNLANGAISTNPEHFTDSVLRDPGRLRLSPGIVGTAAARVPLQTELAYYERSNYPDINAVCPASIELFCDETPTSAERVWRWTVDVARNSELIERIRDSEAT